MSLTGYLVILWHIILTYRWKEATTIFVTRVTRDIIGDKSSICVFPIFTKANSRRRVYARAFKGTILNVVLQYQTIVRDDKPRSSIGPFLDENDESGKGQTERRGLSGCPWIDARPRECKCKTAADPFFFTLIGAALSPSGLFSCLHMPRHQSLRSSPSPLPASHCYARTDKLISSGKSCSSSCISPRIRSPFSPKNPCMRLQSGTGNLILSRFFPFFLAWTCRRVSPFAFYFPSADRQDSTNAR